MVQTPLSTKNEVKLGRLVDATHDILWTNFHKQSDFHRAYTVNTIGDSIYKFAPRLYSGLISEAAKEALDKKSIVRSQLCKEHPKPRQDTAVDIINTFDYHRNRGSGNTVIKTVIREALVEGSRVNLVLSEENTKLVPHQKQGLAADVCYKLAGIELVPDVKEPEKVYHYKGKVYTSQPEIARDLDIRVTTVRSWVHRGLITVERKER